MEQPSSNPYAAPSAEVPFNPASLTGSFFRDGNLVVVSQNAELPARCVITNEPDPENRGRKTVTMAWTPPWAYVSLLAGFLLGLLLIMVFQKKVKFTFTLGPEARKRVARKRMIATAVLATAVGLFFLAANLNGDSAVGFTIVTGIVLLIASLVMFAISSALKPVKYRDGWLQVKGCSPEFLDSLSQASTHPI